jgi:stage II sporulation protein M
MMMRLLKRNLGLMVSCATALVLGAILGAVAYPLLRGQLPELIQAAFGGMMLGGDWEIIGKVFLRNVSASLIIMLLGITVILPPVVLALNGFVIGLIFRFAMEKGMGPLSVAAGILPHGMFELPAIFLSAAVGMRVGLELATKKGRRISSGAQAIREAAAAYMLAVLPLLAIAAVVEILVSKNMLG